MARIAQGYPKNVSERLFLLASYLLIKGERTFINSAGAGVNYYPEYALPIGPARDRLPDDVARYAWNGVYKREFEHAIVVINPHAEGASLTFPGSFRLVIPAGGGATGDAEIDAQGQYIGGSLTYQDVTALTLAPGTAAVLMRK